MLIYNEAEAFYLRQIHHVQYIKKHNAFVLAQSLCDEQNNMVRLVNINYIRLLSFLGINTII